MPVLDDFGPEAKAKADQEREDRDRAFAQRQRLRDERSTRAIMIIRAFRRRHLAHITADVREQMGEEAWLQSVAAADQEAGQALAAAGLSWNDCDFRSCNAGGGNQ